MGSNGDRDGDGVGGGRMGMEGGSEGRITGKQGKCYMLYLCYL